MKLLSSALILSAVFGANALVCPFYIVSFNLITSSGIRLSSKFLQIDPPAGTDITLCSTECLSSCDYFITVPDYGVCKSVDSQAVRAQVLDDKTCAVYA